MGGLREAAVPAGEVNTIEQALQDPQVAARELVVQTNHPRYGTLRTLASPVRVGQPDRHQIRRAPRLGEQTNQLLRDILHYDDRRLAEATAHGAFGTTW